MQERHDILARTIGYLDEEQKALDTGYVLLYASFSMIFVGNLLEILFFWMYNGPCHPFANILKDYSDEEKCNELSNSIGNQISIYDFYLDSIWKDVTTLPSKMKNIVNGSLFLSDDPSKNGQRSKWYQVKRNKIVVGAISILFCLSLTLLFVAIHLVTSQSSGEKLNISYDLLNIMYVPYMENVGLLLQMIVYVITMIT